MSSMTDHHASYNPALTAHFSHNTTIRGNEIDLLIQQTDFTGYENFVDMLNEHFTTKDLIIFASLHDMWLPMELQSHAYYVATVATQWTLNFSGDPIKYTTSQIDNM